MRIAAFLLFLLRAGLWSCSGQGTVTFQNSVTFQTVDPSGGSRLVYAEGSPLDPVNGVALAGTQFVAELYAGTSANSLTPVTSSISRFRSSTTLNKGKWGVTTISGGLNAAVVIPGSVIGDALFLQVKVWDFEANGGIGNANNTYLNAVGEKGGSIVFTYKVPQPTDPPFYYYMENLQAFGVCPEPSGIALGLMTLVFVGVCKRGKSMHRKHESPPNLR